MNKINRDSFFERIINFVSKYFLNTLIKTKITPNQITIFGSLMGITGTLLYFYNSNLIFRIISSVLLLTYIICDFLDGDLARKKNLHSVFGAMLDQFFDKIIFLLIILLMILITDSKGILELYQILFLGLSIVCFHFYIIQIKEYSFNKRKKVIKKFNFFNLYNIFLRPSHTNIIFFFIFFFI